MRGVGRWLDESAPEDGAALWANGGKFAKIISERISPPTLGDFPTLMIERLQLWCFVGTYSLALLSDLARAATQNAARWYLTLVLTLAGWGVHTAYLSHRIWRGGQGASLTVYESLLLVAWLLAAIGIYLIVRSPRRAAVGVFVMPLVLGLSLMASIAPQASWADWGGWVRFWGTTHGLFLLVGAVASCVSCAAGAMYLMQSHRLKHKKPSRWGFNLPSLEQSERLNQGAIAVAFPLLTVGIGIGMGLQWAKGILRWDDPKVLSGLAMWLVFAILTHARFWSEMRGRRVMILTIVAFGFMIFALAGVDLFLPTAHGAPTSSPEPGAEGASAS